MKTIFNPYLPSTEYLPDCEPHVFGGRVYLYGSHDLAGGDNYCLGDYVCWSAPVSDLSDWKYEGVIYRRDQNPENRDGVRTMEAPDCAKGPDGRYYLYFTFNDSEFCIRVCVADKPEGPFETYGYIQNPDGSKYFDAVTFDPAVLVDDDGKIYLYYGFIPPFSFTSRPVPQSDGAYVVELEKDMKTVKGSSKLVLPASSVSQGTGFEGHAFFEAISIRKYDGWYYLVYDSEQFHELAYASSRFPDRDFKFGGTLISNGDIGWNGITEKNAKCPYANIHGGMLNIGSKYFVGYHRHTHGTQFSRQGTMEEVHVSDGKISQASLSSFGLSGGSAPARGLFPAYICAYLYKGNGANLIKWGPRNCDGPFIIEAEDHSRQYVTNISDDSHLQIRSLVFDGNEKKITLNIRSGGKGEFIITAGAEIARININSSDTWIDVSAELSNVQPGTYPLELYYTGTESSELNSIEIA